MVKKTLVDKNIIRALTIGLSLAIANQPLVAMAAENDTPAEDSVPMISVETTEEGIADEAEEKADEIQTEITEAEEVAEDAIELVTEDIPSEEVQEAAETLADLLDYTKEEEDFITPEVIVEEVESNLTIAETEEQAAENAAARAEDQADITEEKAGEAQDIVSEVEEMITEIQEKIENAGTAIETSDAEIEATEDTETAQESYDNAETAVNDVIDAISEGEEKLTSAQENFDNAKDAYDEAVEEYNNLSELHETFKGNVEDRVEDAEDYADDAKDSLDTLAEQAGDLASAASAAKEDVENSGIAHIKDLEDAIAEKLNNGQSVPFTGNGSFAEYFDAIVKDYYVPDMLEGTFVKAEWHRHSGNYTYENNGAKSTQGDVLNYCDVTYIDKNGEEQHQLLNYKISNGNKTNDARWPGIVIFEKTEHTILDNSEATTEELNTLNEGSILEKNDNSYIKEDDKIYKLSEGVEEVLVTEDDNTVIADQEDKVEYTFENNQLIKTVTNDVTVTTYTGATLDAQAATYSTEEDAQAAYKSAMQTKIDNLNDDESIIIDDKEFKKGSTADLTGYEKATKDTYSATGTFSEKFSDTVNHYTDKYQFTNGTYLLGIGENHKTDEITHYDKDGKVVIEYAKVTKVNNSNYSWLYDAIISWGSDKANLEKKLTEKFAKEGKIFVGIDPTNWGLGTADVFIIDAQTLDTKVTAETEEAAVEAFEAAAKTKLSENAELYNVHTLTDKTTTYGYNALTYYIKSVILKEDEVISKTTYDTTEVNVKTEYRNDKWYTGDIILLTQDKAEGMDYKTDGKQSYNKNDMISDEKETQDTKNFRDTLQQAEDLANQYQAIADKAAEAQDKFIAARDHVNDLEELIGKISSNASIDKDVTEFTASLDKAIADFEQAKKDKDDLVEKLSDLKDKLDDKIDELTKEIPQEEEEEEVVTPTPGTEEEEPVVVSDEEEKKEDEEEETKTETEEEEVKEEDSKSEETKEEEVPAEEEQKEEKKEEVEEKSETESNEVEKTIEEKEEQSQVTIPEITVPLVVEPTTAPIVEQIAEAINNAEALANEIPDVDPAPAQTTIEENNVPTTDAPAAEENNGTENTGDVETVEGETQEIDEPEVALADKIETDEIDDPEVALADKAELPASKMYVSMWWSLLLLIIILITSYYGYKKVKKHNKEKEEKLDK